MTTEVILLKQHPVIKHDLITVGKQVDERLAALNLAKLVATEDTISALKKLRAELNAELKNYEEQRKVIKNLVIQPYADMEEVYKLQVSEKYKNGIDTLKNTIDQFETMVKDNKQAELEEYFAELVRAEAIDFLTFADTKISVNLSTSLKKYKEELQAIVERVKADTEMIKLHEAADRLMIEYRKDLNVSRATLEINNQIEAERKEKERLFFEKVQRRERQLQMECNMIKDSFSNAWVEILEKQLTVSIPFVLEATDQDWNDKVNEIKKQLQARAAISNAAKAAAEPLQAPTVVTQAPAPELLTARFEVVGTLSELQKLKAFILENNYQYKNI